MWTPIAIAALALAPAQPGALTLSNVRNTYGELGGVRPEGKLLPGDVLFVGFDIEGITVAPDGKAEYSMAIEVVGKAGEVVWKDKEPIEKVDFIPLGGSKIPGKAFITIGLDQPAGAYTLKVTVTDKATKSAKTLERKFEVAPRDFGIAAVFASVDERGTIPAPTTGIVGQSVFIQFGVVTFARDPAKKQPDVQVEMAVIDEAGKPTLAKPVTFTLNGGVDEKDGGFTLRFLLPMTRAGKFTVRLKATDKIANKSATFDLPLVIVPSAN
jgi:hypothetical protein